MNYLKNLKLHYSIIFIAIILVVLSSSNEPRGSDQFWYLADAYSVANGSWSSNNYFPNTLIPDGNNNPSFVHNRPITYIAGFLVYFGFDAVFAYKLINILSLSLIILCFRKIITKTNESKSSFILFIALLLGTPATIWSLFNPLTQIFDSLLFCLVFYLIYFLGVVINQEFIKSIKILFLLIFVSAIAIFQRQDFIFYLSIFSLFLLCRPPSLNYELASFKKRLFIIFLYLGSIFFIKMVIKFPSHLNNSIPFWGAYAFGTNNDWGNMVLYFADKSFFESFDAASHFQRKIVIFIIELFSFDILKSPLILVFCLFILFSIFSIKKSIFVPFYFIIALIIIVSFSTLFYFQFQYRYLYFAYPIVIYGLITTTPIIFFEKNFKRIVISLFSFSMVLSLLMLFYSNKKIMADSMYTISILQSLPMENSFEGNILVLWDASTSLSFGYNYPKSKVFYVTPSTVGTFFWSDVSIILDKNSQIKNADSNIFIGFSKIQNIQGGWEVWKKN